MLGIVSLSDEEFDSTGGCDTCNGSGPCDAPAPDGDGCVCESSDPDGDWG